MAASLMEWIQSSTPYFYGILLALGPLIFFHELGHFIVAKLIGVRVEVFSLGFGPRLFGWKRGHTDYRVSALPLGGYVKMLGENPDEDLRGSPEEFQSRSRGERFAVLVMGATMNILLAVLVMAGLYMHGIPAMKYDDEPAVVGSVQKDSPAERAGLMPRDRILEVGETPTPTWSDFRVTVALNPGRTLPFRIVRDGEERTVMVSIGQTQRDAVGRVGVSPYLGRILVTSVKPGGPAEEAGLRKDDEIASVAGLDPGLRLEEALSALSAGGGEPVALVLRRGDATIEAALRPREEAEGRFSPGFEIYPETVIKKYGFAQAVQESLRYNWRNSDLLFRTIRGLATRSLSIKTLSGPIEIFKLSGEAWKSGAVGFFIFMAMVSLQLGIINLLPIPVLDGGHIFILMVEGVMRRDLSNAVKERLIQAGLVLLVLLMGTVLYFDVYKNWLFKS